MSLRTIQSVEELVAFGAYLYKKYPEIAKVEDYKIYARDNNKMADEGKILGHFFTTVEGVKSFTADIELIPTDAVDVGNFPYKLPVMHNIYIKDIAKKKNLEEDLLSEIKLSVEELFGIRPLTNEQMLAFPLGKIDHRPTPVFTKNENRGTGKRAVRTSNKKDVFKTVSEAGEKKAAKAKQKSADLSQMTVVEREVFEQKEIEQEIYQNTVSLFELDCTDDPKSKEFNWVNIVDVRNSDKLPTSWVYTPNLRTLANKEHQIQFSIGAISKDQHKLTLVVKNGDSISPEEVGTFVENLLISEKTPFTIHDKDVHKLMQHKWAFYSLSNYRIFGVEYK